MKRLPSISRLHEAIQSYTAEWCKDAAGPWWESDLSGQLYGILSKYFPQSRSSGIEINMPPRFLEKWSAPRFRRLTAEFHVPGAGRGTYPDFSHRSADGRCFEWVLEIKTWSIASVTVRGVQNQAEKLVEVMLEDIRKWLRRKDCQYVLAFGTVIAPRKLETKRSAGVPKDYLTTFADAARSALDENTPKLDRYAGSAGDKWDLGIVCKQVEGERVFSHRDVSTHAVGRFLSGPD